jgi:hypothetical protein
VTEESTFERVNREHRERDQKAEGPNRRYAVVLDGLWRSPDDS